MRKFVDHSSINLILNPMVLFPLPFAFADEWPLSVARWWAAMVAASLACE